MEVPHKFNHSTPFLKSALTDNGYFMSNIEVIEWFKQRLLKTAVKVRKIDFKEMKEWSLTHEMLTHKSGRFFKIEGLKVKTNWGPVTSWEQPIINQPEIGFLGFITKEFDGVLHFLVQAKIEPGNINHVQLSPTLQATRSNYLQIHKGKSPLYLEYFLNAKKELILLDQLQSEQGARFLKKRNRNIIIKVNKDIKIDENFVWLTLGQIKELLKNDNVVNMDTRTVISGIPFGNFEIELLDALRPVDHKDRNGALNREFLKSALCRYRSLNSTDSIITFLTELKSAYDLELRQVPLNSLKDWVINESEIYNKDFKYFKVVAVDVEIGNREVKNWCQPMVQPAQEGICAFVCKLINGIMHFAVQAKLECGNIDIIEFAPTVQCLTGNYRQTQSGSLPFLDYVLNAKAEQIYFDTMQSEEGGRFFREHNRNMIVIANDEVPVELPDKYIWMTLNQINKFLKFNNYLNIQARSLIAAISYV